MDTTSQSQPIKDTLCRISYPPHRPDVFGKSVFLAGSIEMGTAEDWQRWDPVNSLKRGKRCRLENTDSTAIKKSNGREARRPPHHYYESKAPKLVSDRLLYFLRFCSHVAAL
jgi:hypothetical protein